MAVADADQLSQHGFIDVGQLVDVEAAGTRLVLSQTLTCVLLSAMDAVYWAGHRAAE